MTRSKKKAIVKISKARDETNRRRERHKVKQLLSFDPDSDMLNADPRELGGDEWGTRFDMEYDEPLDDYWDEVREKMTRK